jgi:dCTP deaminase
MLSDQDILSELLTSDTEEGSARLVDHFPRESGTDWDSLPLSDQQWNAADSPIQPASIDLHVGHIYVPGTPPGSLGGEGRGALSHVLRPGDSVVVSTYERISLPAWLGGIVFPPSKLSSSGILVANIGHIDPGFQGQLRFTLINMGASDYPLERGVAAVGTLMLFRLSSRSTAPWSMRHGAKVSKGEPGKAETDVLAKDFADIESRSARIAKETVNKLSWRFSLWAALLPMLFGIGLAVWAIWFETGRSLADRIDRNDQAIADIRVSLGKIEANAASGTKELAQLQSSIDKTTQGLSDLRDNIQKMRTDTGRR